MGWNDRVDVSTLIGKTLVSVVGAESGSDEILFTDTNGNQWRMYHEQDCCESVSVEDVAGNIEDLIGAPILQAEEVTNSPDLGPKTYTITDTINGGEYTDSDDSYTWTFYKLATVKGYVTIRWYGSSNGYYSESVEFEKVSVQ